LIVQVKWKGAWKIGVFRQISCYISKMIQDRAKGPTYNGTSIWSRKRPVYRHNFQWPWTTVPLSHVSRSRQCLTLNVSLTVAYKVYTYLGLQWIVRSCTCPANRCNFEWTWMTVSDLANVSCSWSGRYLPILPINQTVVRC